MVPPQLKLEVTTSRDTKPKPWEQHPEPTFITKIVKEKATITKRSKRIFTSRLFIEVFTIAEEDEPDRNNYILMGHTKGDFLFDADGLNSTVSFRANPVECTTYIQKGSSQRRGETYLGYIVVITDRNGIVLQTKTNITGKWAKKEELLPKLRDMWQRGRGSPRSRHFDKNGDKVPLPRVKHWFGGQE